jgi:hypothetical protein
MGFCKDGFDKGGIDISGCSDLIDGHFQFDGPGALSSSPGHFYNNINGVHTLHCGLYQLQVDKF